MKNEELEKTTEFPSGFMEEAKIKYVEAWKEGLDFVKSQMERPGVGETMFIVEINKNMFPSIDEMNEDMDKLKEHVFPFGDKVIEMPNKTQGKRFNEGKRRWSLLDLKYLEGLVEVLEMGAAKYSDFNWQLGLPTTEVYESLMRHVVAWKSGEDKDAESGLDHIDHAICNLYFMKWMIANKPEFDNRKRVIKPNSDFEPIKYPDENEK